MPSPVFPWEAFGQVWHLHRPPVPFEDPEILDVEDLIVLLLSHLPAAEQEDFRVALEADEDLDLDTLEALVNAVHDVICPDFPRPTLLTLLSVFRQHRAILHGRLIGSGQPKGVDGLNVYDAACLGLTILDENHRGLDGWTFHAEGRGKLLQHLGVNQAKVGLTQIEELEALQAGMGFAPGQTSAPARPQTQPAPAE